MIRIYLTTGDIEGYMEGCSCCSARDSANLDDVKKLISRIDKQKNELSLLAELIEEHGRDAVIYWFKIYEHIRELKAAIEGGLKYQEDRSIQGTFYKESFENLAQNRKELKREEIVYKKLPSAFKKYMSITNE